MVPQVPATGGHLLIALHAQSYQPDATTAAIVHNIALRQRPDGSWTGFATRPPISGGDIRETAVALHGLDLYAPAGRRAEMNERIARARKFLLQTTPKTPEESIVRLMGLAWAGASQKICSAPPPPSLRSSGPMEAGLNCQRALQMLTRQGRR
ncbi:MAG: hypothetical protein WDO18_01855 [Acidobacteriota bacterium]